MNASWYRVFNVTTTSTSGALDGLGPAAAARPRGTASRAAERTRRPLLKRKIVPGTGATLSLRADVAELVDAHGSGPCGRKPVEVQVLSSALSERPLRESCEHFVRVAVGGHAAPDLS